MRFRATIVLIVFCVSALLPCGAQDSGNGRPKVGLVLGGGGAKGAAEVGVLKVIEEVGIPIDYIAGTSIGSINGGLYSIGYRAEHLDSLFRNQKWLDLFMAGNVTEMLSDLTGMSDSVSFDSLPIPFRCVAVDVRSHKEIILDRGNLALAMRASMAIPGAFKPVKVGGMTLVDGGVINNLPVDVVRAMGADVVIAVDLTQNKHKPREVPQDKRTGIGLIDWAVMRPDWKKHYENRHDADVYINPNLKGYRATSFKKKDIERMISIGYAAGNEAREQLVRLKERIGM